MYVTVFSFSSICCTDSQTEDSAGHCCPLRSGSIQRSAGKLVAGNDVTFLVSFIAPVKLFGMFIFCCLSWRWRGVLLTPTATAKAIRLPKTRPFLPTTICHAIRPQTVWTDSLWPTNRKPLPVSIHQLIVNDYLMQARSRTTDFIDQFNAIYGIRFNGCRRQ